MKKGLAPRNVDEYFTINAPSNTIELAYEVVQAQPVYWFPITYALTTYY